MKSLTIILKRRCARFLDKLTLRKPYLIRKILREETKRRSLEGIFEGFPNLSQIKKDLITTPACAIYIVLRVKFKSDFNSANSESIWEGIDEFAKQELLPFSVFNSTNCKVIEFEKKIQL